MPQPSLAGLRVLITRPAGGGAEAWARALAAAGAEPLPYPTVAIAPPESWDGLDRALVALDSYDWLIFTSQTTVAVVVDRLPGKRFPTRMRAQIATVGKATARAVALAGGAVALVPADERQEGLLASFTGLPAGSRVLLPQADGARPLLAQTLQARGIVVHDIVVYRTVPVAEAVAPPPFDVATFASPSALRAYVARAGAPSLVGKLVVVIGPTTAAEARAHGLTPAVAVDSSVEALVSAISGAFSKQGDP